MSRRTRLHVNVSTPDGAVGASRGLASWLAGIAPATARGEVTIALVNDRRMRILNRTFRGKDAVTDVLSFAAGADETAGGSRTKSGPVPLGDIVIASGVAARQAAEHGHSTSVEFKVLALHGLLHLIGYDHEAPDDNGRMARAEARLRARAGLPSSVIARANRLGSNSRLPVPGSRRRS
jgi:probable rRNA maturation factor